MGSMNKKGLFFGILIIIGGLIGAVWGWMYAADATESNAWPTVRGVVLASSISSTLDNGGSGGNKRSFTPVVSYRYDVDGQSYDSDRVHFDALRRYSDQEEVQAVIDQYPAGDEVLVYYAPDDPANAVLMPGASWRVYMPMGFALALAVLGLYWLKEIGGKQEEKS